MINYLKKLIKPYVANYVGRKLPLTWVKRDNNAWLGKLLSGESISPPPSSLGVKIEKRAEQTNKKGAQPLWEGYTNNNDRGGEERMPNMVRTHAAMGNLYTYLVEQKKPDIIVEFGTAFGVSGMYFLAGLEHNKKGKLLTFDPNTVWATLAKENLSSISNKFELTNGTFEDNINRVLPEGQYIDIAFIDAIHTREFVYPQLEIVLSRSKKGTIVIFDDITFSEDMRLCWQELSQDERFTCSVDVAQRVGIVEVK